MIAMFPGNSDNPPALGRLVLMVCVMFCPGFIGCGGGGGAHDGEPHVLAAGFGTGENIAVSYARSNAEPSPASRRPSVEASRSAQQTEQTSTAPQTDRSETKPAARQVVARQPAPVAKSTTVVAAAPQAEKSTSPASPNNLPAGTGGFRGAITFDGPPPKQSLLYSKGANVKDPTVCGIADMPDESLIVNPKNGGVQNVCVYLPKKPKGWKGPAPAKPVTFDQKGCRFLPHILHVRTGQQVMVLNGDPLVHNTHTTPLRSGGFNNAIGSHDRVGIPLVYRRGESLPVSVKCDLHNWMKAYHLVTDHPFAAITDADGKFAIAGLPPGKHKFRIWQERAGYLQRSISITIKAGEFTEQTFSFKPSKFEE